VRVCAEQKLHTPHTQLGNRLHGAITSRAERRVNSRDFGDDRMSQTDTYGRTNVTPTGRWHATTEHLESTVVGSYCRQMLQTRSPTSSISRRPQNTTDHLVLMRCAAIISRHNRHFVLIVYAI